MEKHLLHDYKSIIKECFESDEDLLSKWHICSGEGLDICVDRTYGDIAVSGTDFYSITKDGELVGFFGHEKVQNLNALTGFFIKPEYRNKEDVSQFWDIILKELNGPFICGIYEKNDRAKKFLEKNNGKLVASFKSGAHGALMYGFNLCQ